MALLTISAIVGLVGTAASLSSIGYQAAQGAPSLPDGASTSRNIAQAQAASLPLQKRIAALEQMGGKVGGIPSTMTRAEVEAEIQRLNQAYKSGGKSDGALLNQVNTLKQALKAAPQQAGAKVQGGPGSHTLDQFTIYKDQSGNYLPEAIGTADFTGYGTADIEGQLAQQYTQMQNELSKKYGVQFAEEARREQELADPQGTAARAKEYELIQKEMEKPSPINPLSSTLESQIDSQLKAGSHLDPMSRDLLEKAVERASADRGGSLESNLVDQSMSTGAEGEARRQVGLDKSQAFLNSGSSPADIEYRREQQLLADAGSFAGGRTPESQFGSISSNGSAPFYPGQPSPTMPGGAAQTGQNAASAQYAARAQQASQPNPWLSGLSAALSATSGAVKAFA